MVWDVTKKDSFYLFCNVKHTVYWFIPGGFNINYKILRQQKSVATRQQFFISDAWKFRAVTAVARKLLRSQRYEHFCMVLGTWYMICHIVYLIIYCTSCWDAIAFTWGFFMLHDVWNLQWYLWVAKQLAKLSSLTFIRLVYIVIN